MRTERPMHTREYSCSRCNAQISNEIIKPSTDRRKTIVFDPIGYTASDVDNSESLRA